MGFFDEFISIYHKKGFLLSNCYDSLESFINQAKEKQFSLQKIDDNFLFFDKNILYFFINNDEINFNIKNSLVKILEKNEENFKKYENFLKNNGFCLDKIFAQMVLKNQNLNIMNFDFIHNAEQKDINEIYSFFKKYFSYEFTYFFNKNDLLQKLDEILVYKEDESIRGACMFSKSFNAAYLDYIAVDRNLKCKNIAFGLLNHFFKADLDKKFFKLFVNTQNQKAIKFYEKANFAFNKLELRFYKS